MNIKTHSCTILSVYTYSATYLLTRNAADILVVPVTWFSDILKRGSLFSLCATCSSVSFDVTETWDCTQTGCNQTKNVDICESALCALTMYIAQFWRNVSIKFVPMTHSDFAVIPLQCCFFCGPRVPDQGILGPYLLCLIFGWCGTPSLFDFFQIPEARHLCDLRLRASHFLRECNVISSLLFCYCFLTNWAQSRLTLFSGFVTMSAKPFDLRFPKTRCHRLQSLGHLVQWMTFSWLWCLPDIGHVPVNFRISNWCSLSVSASFSISTHCLICSVFHVFRFLKVCCSC